MSVVLFRLMLMLWPGVCAAVFLLMAGLDSDLTSFLFKLLAFVYTVFAPLIVFALYET